MNDTELLFAERRQIYKFRDGALLAGDEFYISYTPCVNGHAIPVRWTKDRSCVECLAECK